MQKEVRSKGVGTAAMDLIEEYAGKSPWGSENCKTIAITTLSRRYCEDDGEEWRGAYAKRGMEAPKKGTSIADWYSRRGYVLWKEEPRYKDTFLDGGEFMLIAAFMRKTIQ